MTKIFFDFLTHVLATAPHLPFGGIETLRKSVLLPFLLVTACGGPVDDINETQDDIIQGRVDPGHRSVGVVLLGTSRCTGTLIGPRTVITAAHCFAGNPTVVRFLVNRQLIRATRWVLHEDWGDCDPADLTTCANDFAVVFLAGTPTGVVPRTLATNPPTTELPVQFVGYGLTGPNAPGDLVRRIADADIDQTLISHQISTDDGAGEGSTCNGDSGAPVFANVDGREVIMAIHSIGNCADYSADGRVDRIARRTDDGALSWIERQSANVNRAPQLSPFDGSWFGDPAERERPQTVLDGAPGNTVVNVNWNYAMGFHFTPTRDGVIHGLGGTFTGTKRIRLYNRDTGELLEEGFATADGDVYGPIQPNHVRYGYTPIAPVSVFTNIRYTVAVYLEGSGASYRTTFAFPYHHGDLRIDASTYVSTSSNPDRRPTNAIYSRMYGQADVVFTRAFCGDGFINRNRFRQETCDDGNNVSGDGCSSACLIE